MLCNARLATYAFNMQVNLETSTTLIHSHFSMSSLRISKCLVCKPESMSRFLYIINTYGKNERIQSQGNNMMNQER